VHVGTPPNQPKSLPVKVKQTGMRFVTNKHW